MFRWPLRVTEYFYLALVVILARLLGHGLATTHLGRRIAGSVVAIGVPAYLAWAGTPASLHRLVAGTALVVVLTACAVATSRLGARRTVALAGVCIVGTGIGLTLQLKSFGENQGSRGWHAPSDVAAMQSRFADRTGTVMQFSDFTRLQHRRTMPELQAKWRYYLPGSLYDVAGVDAVNHYTGMGFVRFQRSLCMAYDGFTRDCGYRSIWQPPAPSLPPLADLMKVDTVVVEPRLARGVSVPAGWTRVTDDPQVQVYRRTEPLPWPGSRLSFVPHGFTVTSAATDDARHEHVDLSATGQGGQAVFATLGWPGWRATFDGHEVPVGRNSAGLLTVTLPANASGRLELSFTPPGLVVGVAAALVGLIGAVALGWFGRRRRPRSEEPATAEPAPAS
jgi:hypothetical protein